MIDWGRVNELRLEIGADDFPEVVSLFMEEVDEVVARLPAIADAKGLESALHFVKGSALNLGFSALAALCQEGERRAAAGDTGGDRALVSACYDASKAAFAAGLARLGADAAA